MIQQLVFSSHAIYQLASTYVDVVMYDYYVRNNHYLIC